MVDTRKIVKVFLASPGDLQDERIAAKAAVDEFNATWADSLGYQVELVGWEDTVSAYGRPQAIINRDLDRCELFIGMMWKRWGTPPDLSATYSSGFEEEFSRSVDSRQTTGKPEISLFFKDIDSELLRDPGPELQKVVGFKNKIISEKTVYFETFAGFAELGSKVRRCVSKYVQRLAAEANRSASEPQERPSEGHQAPIEDVQPTRETPLSVEGAQFLREFIDSTERQGYDASAVKIARFRLLAGIIKAQGNDAHPIGVHDANMLFVHRSEFDFSRRELYGLIESGLSNFTSENTPVWHWYLAVDGFSRKQLVFFSLNEPSTRQVGALAAMTLISEPLPSLRDLDRADFVGRWLHSETGSDVKVAALDYLADCGIVDDLAAIRQEFDKGNYQTTGSAVHAILRINLRESLEKAIMALYDLQPTTVEQALLNEIFPADAPITTQLLTGGITHRSDRVRRIIVKLLRDRNAMTTDISERLLSDSDAAVRFEAVKSLIAAGRVFANDDVKRILVKSGASGLGLFALPLYEEGEGYWDRFQHDKMMAMTDRELQEIADSERIFERDAQFVMDERHFASRGEQLRNSVLSQFKGEYSASIAEMERIGTAADTIEMAKSLEDHTTKQFTRKGLDIICRNGNPQDLPLVRRVLKSGFVKYSIEDIEYLRKFGEWEDVSLIIASVDRFESARGSLLSGIVATKYHLIARALYSMGRTRFGELLSMEMPALLLSRLIIESSRSVFHKLDDEPISRLLHSEHSEVRKAAALKCIRSLPKRRLKSLLHNYLSADQSRYYNVAHWLDFGISAPRDRAIDGAAKEISKNWPSAG